MPWRLKLRLKWRPRYICSVKGCLSVPVHHYRIRTSDQLVSVCSTCNSALVDGVARPSLVPLSENEVSVAEVMGS